MFETMNDIVTLSRENGYTFFNKDRQEEHKTRVLPTLYGGKYFITESIHKGRKFFSIYKALKDGACDIVTIKSYTSMVQRLSLPREVGYTRMDVGKSNVAQTRLFLQNISSITAIVMQLYTTEVTSVLPQRSWHGDLIHNGEVPNSLTLSMAS